MAIYRPAYYKQADGTAYQWLNCMAAGGSEALDRDTLGGHRTSPAYVRSVTKDTYGGLDFNQIDSALKTIDPERDHLTVFNKTGWDSAMTLLKSGRGFMCNVSYGVIVDSHYNYGQSGTFRGNHQIYLNEKRLIDGKIYGYDPLLDGRRTGIPKGPIWYPESVLKKAAGAAKDGNNAPMGLGSVQGAFTTLHLIKATVSTANIRFGASRSNAVFSTLTLGKTVQWGTTLRGETISGNSIWYRVWVPSKNRVGFMHSSVVAKVS